MSKKISLINHSVEDLHKLVGEKREKLRHLRFAVAGSKNANVKQVRTLRKEVARTLTELTQRERNNPSTGSTSPSTLSSGPKGSPQASSR